MGLGFARWASHALGLVISIVNRSGWIILKGAFRMSEDTTSPVTLSACSSLSVFLIVVHVSILGRRRIASLPHAALAHSSSLCRCWKEAVPPLLA